MKLFLFLFIGCLSGLVLSIAYASLTITSSSVTSDVSLGLAGTGTSTLDVGASTLSLQTTGNGPITAGSGLFTIPGTLSFGVASGSKISTTQATTTNLSITGLAGASGCLSVTASGVVATSTCNGTSTNLGTITTSSPTAANGVLYSASAGGSPANSSGTFTFGNAGLAVSVTSTFTGSVILPPAASSSVSNSTGSLYYDTTQEAFAGFGSNATPAMLGYIPRTLSIQAIASGTDQLVSNTTNEQFFTTSYTIPANYLTAGKALNFTWAFFLNHPVTPTTTERLRIYASSSANLVALYDSTAISETGTITNRTAGIGAEITTNSSTASNATVYFYDIFHSPQPTDFNIVANTLVPQNAIDTTIPETIKLSMTFATTTATAGQVQLRLFKVVEDQ